MREKFAIMSLRAISTSAGSACDSVFAPVILQVLLCGVFGTHIKLVGTSSRSILHSSFLLIQMTGAGEICAARCPWPEFQYHDSPKFLIYGSSQLRICGAPAMSTGKHKSFLGLTATVTRKLMKITVLCPRMTRMEIFSVGGRFPQDVCVLWEVIRSHI
ncbi:hypothetical protein EDD17DRAFT_458201 [Pisolithus thermaeus]|nr:hypothetical protein EV401DRAFT_1458850 [Pisolithus croceorrhizus]KAI6169025.1 hypothetical protein EDD17DRAFT_458201 [Pisolithus thermaeus]